MGQVVVIEGGNGVVAVRVAAAKRISKLMEDWTNNTFSLGDELADVRNTFPEEGDGNRPGLSEWIKQETGLSFTWAMRLIKISEKFPLRARKGKLPAFRVLDFLSTDNIADDVRDEIVGRTQRGEKITREDAKEIVEQQKLPSPKAANAQAKEEGRPVLASDGYIYFGTDPDKAKEGEDRRTMVFGVRRALDTLAAVHLTGLQFLQYAMPHQLWTKDEEQVIKDALRWLTSLDSAWDKWPKREPKK